MNKKLLACVELVCDKMHQKYDLYIHDLHEIILKVPFKVFLI